MPKEYSLDVPPSSSNDEIEMTPGPNDFSAAFLNSSQTNSPPALDAGQVQTPQPDSGVTPFLVNPALNIVQTMGGNDGDLPWYMKPGGVGIMEDMTEGVDKHQGFIPFDRKVRKYRRKYGEDPPAAPLVGLKAGSLGGLSGDAGFFETAFDIAGIDSGKKIAKSVGDTLEKYAYDTPMRTVRDLDSFGDVAAYAGQAVGYVFGYLGSMIPTAIATGGGSAAYRSAAPKVLKGLTKKEIATKTAKAVGKATLLPSIIKNTGHTYRGVREETDVEAPYLALGVGGLSGWMERIGLGKTFEAFFDALPVGAKKQLWQQTVNKALTAAGKAALVEGATEAGQESLQIIANKIADSTYDVVNGENFWRILDASAMGAFGAAPIGGIGGARNYYTSGKKKEKIESVKATLDKLSELAEQERKGSQFQVETLKRELEKTSKLLSDPNYIPTEEERRALFNITERISEETSFSEEQAAELKNAAGSVLSAYDERIKPQIEEQKDLEAQEAQSQADLESRSAELTNTAAQTAGVDTDKYKPEAFYRDPRVSESAQILPEERSPYNDTEAQFEVGQTYLHGVINPNGERDQVEATITKVDKNGRVLESVFKSEDGREFPLITTKRNRTKVLISESEIQNEISLRDLDPNDPKYTKTAEQKNVELEILKRKLRTDKEQEQILKDLAEGPAVIEGTKKRTVEDNIKQREKVEAKRKPREQKPTRKTYRFPQPTPKTKRQGEIARLNRIENAIKKSAIVEVSSRGEARKVAIIKDVQRLPDFGSELKQWTAKAIFEDEILQISIDEEFNTNQPIDGRAVVAINGKLTKEQEKFISDWEQEAVTAAGEPEETGTLTADIDEIFKRGKRATAETPSTKESKSEKVKIVKGRKGAEVKSKKPAQSDTLAGRKLDPDLAKSLEELNQDQAALGDLILDVTALPIIASKRLNIILKKVLLYIKQALRDRQKLKTKKTKSEIINGVLSSIDPSVLDSLGEYFPDFDSDNPSKFIERLVNAAINEGGNDLDGLSNQDKDNDIIGKINNEIAKYIDFPITDGGDLISVTNTNVFKDLENFDLIDGLSLYNDNQTQSSEAILDFSTAGRTKGGVISIKAKDSTVVSYKLNKEAMDQVQLQYSKIKGQEKTIVFAHIPKSLIINEDGDIQYGNWERDTKKGGFSFLKDVSWVGLSRDDFIKFVKQSTKAGKIKQFLDSPAGELAFTNKEEIGAIISSAIQLIKDTRYSDLKKKDTPAYKAIAKIRKSKIKVGNLKPSDLHKLFEHAVNLHLDHFATITEDQLAPISEDRKTLQRLEIYRRKLARAIDRNLPQGMDLPKYGTVKEKTTTVTTKSGKSKVKKTYVIVNDPTNTNNLKPVPTGASIPATQRASLPEKDRFFSVSADKGQKRKSLTPEDQKYAEELLAELDKEIDRISSETRVYEETDRIPLRANNLSGLDRAYENYSQPYSVKDAKDLVGRVRNYINSDGSYVKDSELSIVYGIVSNIYQEAIENEANKFSAEYRGVLIQDEAPEMDLSRDISAKGELDVAVGSDLATGEVSPADVLEASEEEIELRKFLEGKFDDNTEIGRANKQFVNARSKLVRLLQSNNLEDESITQNIIDLQAQMLDGWNKFLEARGTDFLLFDGNELQARSESQYDLYNSLRKENISRIETSSIHTTPEERVKFYVNQFNELKEKSDNLYDAYNEAFRKWSAAIDLIEKGTKKFYEEASRTNPQLLQDAGWAAPPLSTDFTAEKILANPSKYSITGSYNSQTGDYQSLITPESRDFLIEFQGLNPVVKEFREVKKKLLVTASAITMFDPELGSQYGFDASIDTNLEEKQYWKLDDKEQVVRSIDSEGDVKVNFIIGKGKDITPEEYKTAKELKLLKPKKSDVAERGRKSFTLTASDFNRIRKIKNKLEEERETFEGDKLFKKRNKEIGAHLRLTNKLLGLQRSRVKEAALATGKFKMTAKKLRKRGLYFEVILDSFYRGGVRSMDPGSMFGTLISLANKFNEDKFRATQEFFKAKIKKTKKTTSPREETPTTLYYKLYKTLELRDPFKILEHPLFSNSGLYLGPINPKGITPEDFINKKERVRSYINKIMDSYKLRDENESRKRFIKEEIIGTIYDEFIELFSSEAGMVDKESIVKKITDLGAKKNQVLDYLAGALEIPFEPRVMEELEKKEIIEEAGKKLIADLGEAREKSKEAEQALADNKDTIDRAERGTIGLLRERGARSSAGLNEEYNELVRIKNELKSNSREARKELQLAEQKVLNATYNPDILLDDRSGSGEASLDRIGSKYHSVTINNTLPRGYTSVKSDRPSPDMPINRGNAWDHDGLITGVKSDKTTEPELIGSAVGANGIVELLENNRDKLGVEFVDRAISLLSNIPDKYLTDLTMSINTSLRTDKGFELGGSFVEAIKTVFIPVEGKTTDSFTHEFSHYLHAFLPRDMQESVTEMRRNALNKVISNTPDGNLRYRLEIARDILSNIDSREQFNIEKFQEYINKYGERASDMYHLINDNEFFAYVMTKEGQSDINNLSPETNPIGLVSRVKSYLSDLLDWMFNKLGLVTSERQFAKEVLAKFKSGEFTVERQMFTAGPNFNASIRTAKDLQEAINLDVRNSVLQEGGNAEAAKRLSLEAGSFHNMISSLAQGILKEMSESEEFRNLVGKPKFEDGEIVTKVDDVFEISKGASALASLTQSEAIRKILEENETTTNGLIFSAESWMKLYELKQKDANSIPDSMWEQVTKEFFKNTEEFVIQYRDLKEKADALDSDTHKEKLLTLMESLKEKDATKKASMNQVNSLRSQLTQAIKLVKDQGVESKLLQSLKSFGYDLNSVNERLSQTILSNDSKVRESVNWQVESFYKAIWNNADAQIILHKGINRDGKPATWKDLVWTYIVEKELYRDFVSKRHKDVNKLSTKLESEIFDSVDPMIKMVANHILLNHKNDILMNKISEENLRNSLDSYSDYEKEIQILFETDKEYVTRGGKRVLVTVDGPKKAIDKLLKDYNKATGEKAIANRLYLSMRRGVLKEIEKNNNIRVAAHIAGKIIESPEFSESRKLSGSLINVKPVEIIRTTRDHGNFPHPIPEKSVTINWSVSDKKGREEQLNKLDIYINDLIEWISLEENQNDPYLPAWQEYKDHAVAMYLGPSLRDGKSLHSILTFRTPLIPLKDMLAEIGTYTAKVASKHLDNWAYLLERATNWRNDHGEDIEKALYEAARSHGLQDGPIGVADWRNIIGQRFFALAQQTGRLPNVGEVATVSDLTEIKTITKEDMVALNLQVKAFDGLYTLNVKEDRGDLILSRRVNEELIPRDKKSPKKIGRRPLKDTEYTLPKRFSKFAQNLTTKISSLLESNKEDAEKIDALEDKTDKEKRELKLQLFARTNNKDESVITLIANNFHRYVLPFLDNREGKITKGTNPYFTEGIYDEARDAVFAGEINDLADLAMFFSERSVDVTKLGEDEAPVKLTREETLYELVREMSEQTYKFYKFFAVSDDAEGMVTYTKETHDSAFTTARKEVFANYFYYEYGAFETATIHNLVNEAAVQYLDSFASSLKAIRGELELSEAELNDAIQNNRKKEFLNEKKKEAELGEVSMDYENLKKNQAILESKIQELEGFIEKDKKYEMQVHRTWRKVFGDQTMWAIQALTTGVVNVLGTATRSQMRLMVMFGGSASLNSRFALDILRSIVEGVGTFGYGFGKGIVTAPVETVKTRSLRKGLIKFIDEFLNKPYVEDIALGQWKINETLRRINDAGYSARINVSGKIDNYFESVQTRGRIERSEELQDRGEMREALSTLYNAFGVVLAEVPAMAFPRIFDAVGNNISFRMSNSMMTHLEIRLKDVHLKYGDVLWDVYNDPDSPRPDPTKRNVLTPYHAFGDQFLFKADNRAMAHLEEMFGHTTVDYHLEALRFLKELDTNKDASFLTPEQRAQIGIGLVASENLATVANRPLQTKTQANSSFYLNLLGWAVSAAYNSARSIARVQTKGKRGPNEMVHGPALNSLLESQRAQIALVLLGTMTLSATRHAETEEIQRLIYKYLYGEIKTGRHPWEETNKKRMISKALLYGLANFPILNTPANWLLNADEGFKFEPSLFVIDKIKDIVGLGAQLYASPFSIDNWNRALTFYIKKTIPNSRYLVNRFGSIAGTIKLMDNIRLIQRHGPSDLVKARSRGSRGTTSDEVDVQVGFMVNAAMLEDWDSFNIHFGRAGVAAKNSSDKAYRENPRSIVLSKYKYHDPYRRGLDGGMNRMVRQSIVDRLKGSEKEEFLANDENYYKGLRKIDSTQVPVWLRGEGAIRATRMPKKSNQSSLRRAY